MTIIVLQNYNIRSKPKVSKPPMKKPLSAPDLNRESKLKAFDRLLTVMDELRENCLSLFFLGRVVEFREGEVELERENGETVILENDVVFVLIGSDADLSMLKQLGVETENGKYGEVPVYDPETFETNVPGVYVAGHFTNQRHIKGAIDAAKALLPRLAETIRGKKEEGTGVAG